jgi:N-methylhydantoinase B/oxoprolinase/acetone carboxylase alpha subunit
MTRNVTTAIDRLGELKAQIAELEREADKLKDIVRELGAGAYEGERYRATVSMFDRETLDMEAVREKLSPQFLRAHTRVKEVTVVKVTARNNLNVA